MNSLKSFAIAISLIVFASVTNAAEPTVPALLHFESTSLGNVFTANSGTVHLVADKTVHIASGHITLTNEYGASIGTMLLPANASDVSVALSHKGYYQLRADVQTQDGTHLTALTTASVVGPLIPDAIREKSPFGLESVAGARELVIAAGAGYNRGFTPQNGIVKTADGTLIPWARANKGAPPEGPMNYINAIMSPPKFIVAPEHRDQQTIMKSYPPNDWDEYRKVVRVFATAQPWVRYYEGLNEPDAYHWMGTDADLVQYHRVIREELHTVGLGQEMLGPCFWSIDLQHLDKLVKLGFLDTVDGIAMHSYANAPPEGKWIREVDDLKKYLASVGKPNEPIYLTEYGWDIGNTDTPTPEQELMQARYASRGIALLAREHLAASVYFALRYSDNGGKGQNWSLVHEDNTPRPGYAAIATSYRWLTQCTGGTLLHPTPTSYLILYAKGSHTIGVGWETSTSESQMTPPGHLLRAESMTGSPITVDASGRIALTQSPVYFEIDGAGLATPKTGSEISIVRGATKTLTTSVTDMAVPAPLALKGHTITTTTDAVPGTYIGFRKSGSAWETVPIQVLPLWSIASTSLVWPLQDKNPSVRLRVHTLAQNAQITPILRLDDLPDAFGTPTTITSSRDSVVTVPLDSYVPGSRIDGSAVLEGRIQGKPDIFSVNIQGMPVPSQPVTQEDTINWDAMPSVSSALWNLFGPGGKAQIVPADCSATVQSAYGPTALHLRVIVTDDVQSQGQGTTPLWGADSLQIAFDASASKTASERRELEYIVAQRDGKDRIERDRSTIASLTADLPEPRILTHISRVDTVTTYDITLPWSTLGLTQAPVSGSQIGFDIAVNDSDGQSGDRHGLEMTDGIVNTKDTSKFATLLFR